MPTEIERKFLVNKQKWEKSNKGTAHLYRQGYILTDPGKTIRIRLADGKGFITIKGRSTGASRPEYEYTIPENDASELLDQFCSAVISKTRYKVRIGGKQWEVDEFSGDNQGLITAEIELSSEDEIFELPEWVEREITGDARYYNSNLSLNPYRNWRTGKGPDG